MDKLKEYKSKRNFNKTSEPSGSRSNQNERTIFVIQKHDASNLHYDFRLEIDGILASWAVPKGPSTDPSTKRLAIETEDHPMDYAKFEGTIPEGEYGAGKVIVWDYGSYENTKEYSIKEARQQGKIEVSLKGKKLNGKYALIRTGDKESKQWLLIKMADKYSDARRNPTSTEPKSVISGKSLEDL
jgi:DNA ligase D-like protein (predicted 3'-phosphoesterase)